MSYAWDEGDTDTTNRPWKFYSVTKKRRRKPSFNPSSEYCAAAVAEYQRNGGKTTVIERDGDNIKLSIKGESADERG
jgi:hypothetical protein